MEIRTKEVRFDIYCKTCKYEEQPKPRDPCHECLDQPWNTDSRKPICWKEKR